MAADPKLVVALEAQITRFERALKDAGVIADRKASEIEDRFNKVNPKFTGVTAGLTKGMAAVAGIMSIGGIKAAIEKAIGGLSQVNDLAERAGVSTDFIQSLGFAVELAGGSMEDAGRAATKFGKALGDGSAEGNALLKMLEANKVQTKDLVTGALLPAEKQFENWARLIANIEDPVKRLNKVMEVLGDKVGPKMMTTILEIGQKGLPVFIENMKQLGVVATKEVVEKGDQIGDMWLTITRAMERNFGDFVVNSLREFEQIKAAVIYLKNLATTGTGAAPGSASALESQAATLRAQIHNATQGMAGGLYSSEAQARVDKLKADLATIERQISGIKEEQLKPFVAPGLPGSGTILPEDKKPTVTTTTKVSLDDFERQVQTMKEKLLIEEKELETINLSVEARERAKIAITLENAARRANMEAGKANTDVTEEQAEKIRMLAEEYAQLAGKVAAANAPLATFAREARDTNKMLQEAGVNALRGLEDAFIGIASGAKTTKEAIKDMVDAILADLMRLAMRMMITGPIASMLGNYMMPVGPGAPLSLAPPTPFPRAGGGSVARGVPYKVGESGTELFVPDQAGTIVPNQALGRGSGFKLQIINNGAKVDVGEPKKGSDGSTSLTVLVDRITGKNGSTPGTSTNKMLRFQGARIPLTRRA